MVYNYRTSQDLNKDITMKHITQFNKIIVIALAFTCLKAAAGATGGFTTQEAGIITPDVATGMTAVTRYNYSSDGNMVWCPEDDMERGAKCKKWQSIQALVPKGRTYVGFRVVSGSYGYRQLEVYWK